MSIYDLFEKILTTMCQIFFGTVWMATLVYAIIVRVFAVVLVFILGTIGYFAIDILPAYWETLVLRSLIIGSSATFISILIMRIWRPERLDAIYGEHLKKCSKANI